MRWVQSTPPNITPRNGGTVSMRAVLPPGPAGATGLPGPGSAAWQATTAVTTGAIRQAPDGSYIKSTANRTTRASFDATEEGFWTSVLADPTTVDGKALTASYAGLNPTIASPVYTAGNLISWTENGVACSATYNADGTMATLTTGAVTRTFTYNADGTIASVA